MRVKILSPEEYESLKATKFKDIVSDLDRVLLTYNLVAVEQSDETYKVIKFQTEGERVLIITKEQLQQLIFLYGI